MSDPKTSLLGREDRLEISVQDPEDELYLQFEFALDRIGFGVAEAPLAEWYRRAVEKALMGGGFGDDKGRHWKQVLFECYREWWEEEQRKKKQLQDLREQLEEALYQK